MSCSPARLAANLANSAKSTGPKTAEGKARTRANALKHGLTGAGVVVLDEDAEIIDQRFESFQADFRPTTSAGQSLVQRMALLSVRLDRAVEQETAAIRKNVRHARADYDDARQAEVIHLLETLHEQPAINVRKLFRTPEGIDGLTIAWSELKTDLKPTVATRWTARHTERALHLSGRRLTDVSTSRIQELASAIAGDFSLLEDQEGAGLDPLGRREWARDQLRASIDEEIQILEELREDLDFEAFDLDRQEAPQRALFDPSKQATLARQYEAAADRGFYRALREFRKIEAEAAEKPELPGPPILPKPPLASFFLDENRLDHLLPAAEETDQGTEDQEFVSEEIRGWTNVIGPISLGSIPSGAPMGGYSQSEPGPESGGSKRDHPGS